jgi:lactate dehydrogenase-like 2-hydroxyacid dehydrogenase
MTKKHTLLVVNEFHQETISKLDTLYHTHHLWKHSAAEKIDLLEALQGKCRAAATGSWECDSLIYKLNSLQLISCFGVGVDAIDFEETSRREIKVSNTPDVLNDAVADIALALILATTRKLVIADKFVRSGEWKKGSLAFGNGLANKTLGIIGLGRIGEEIVQRALPFKLKIAYHNRAPKNLPYTYYPSIAELAKNSDILLCMLPGGETTQNIIDAEIFRNLGPEGVFINVGRGTTVDEEALVAALQSKQIFAAGLDVYAKEPHVPEALLSMENVVLLPHIGSATIETRRAMGNLLIENLEAFFSNKPLPTEVSQP